MQRRIIYFLTITILFFGANFLVAHIASQTKPFTMRQILNAVASTTEAQGSQKNILTDKIISDIRKRKVDFPLTKENEKLLRDEGASDEIIEAIRQNSPPVPTPIPTPTPITIIKEVPVSSPTPKPVLANTPENGKVDVVLKNGIIYEGFLSSYNNENFVLLMNGTSVKIQEADIKNIESKTTETINGLDTFRLKDGSVVKGVFIRYFENKFLITVGEGTRKRQMSFYAAEIESIEFTIRSNSTPLTERNFKNSIQIRVKVLADNTADGWTNSGWVVRKGQKIRITGRGNISLGGGKYSTPSGVPSLADKDKLIQNEATGGLVAVIGDDNNDFIFIGTAREFTATRNGSLFLGINEGNLDDNSGSFDVTIEIWYDTN